MADFIYDTNHKSIKRKLTFKSSKNNNINRITSGKCLYPHMLFCKQFFKYVINYKLQNTPMWTHELSAMIT